MPKKHTGQSHAQSAQRIELEEIPDKEVTGKPLYDENLSLIQNVKVGLSALVGCSELTVKELFNLKEGELLKLDKNTNDTIDIYLDGKIIARGELVAIDDQFGVRITEILNPNQT